jgi:DNA-binding MarR family transcriptional regulator
MPLSSEPDELAHELRVAIGLLRRRLRATAADSDLRMPEAAALARLDRGGPTTAASLAKAEQISPQSMGATLARLEGRGLVSREHDPADGRRIVLTISPAGVEAMRGRRSARDAALREVLESEFTGPERRTLAAAVVLMARLGEAL